MTNKTAQSVSVTESSRNDAPSDAQDYYRQIVSGADFSVFLELEVYQESYSNPDCVLVNRKTRRIHWFDLDHLSASDADRSRRHVSWHLFRRKFAFSFDDFEMEVMTCDLFSSKIETLSGRSLKPARFKYSFGTPYETLLDTRAAVAELELAKVRLQKALETACKFKVGILIGDWLVLFPVRLVTMRNKTYSLMSKTVVAPSADSSAFSWNTANLAHIAVGTDLRSSILRERRTTGAVRSLLGTTLVSIAPGLFRIYSESRSPAKNALKSGIRLALHPLLHYLAPFDIEYGNCPFIVFGRRPESHSDIGSSNRAP